MSESLLWWTCRRRGSSRFHGCMLQDMAGIWKKMLLYSRTGPFIQVQLWKWSDKKWPTIHSMLHYQCHCYVLWSVLWLKFMQQHSLPIISNFLYSGKYQLGIDKPDPKTWKANFRCAMNSLPDIEEVKDKSIKKGTNAFRVYKMLSASERQTKKGKWLPL